MTTRHNISRANTLYYGSAQYNRTQGGRTGIRMHPLNYHNFGVVAAPVANGVSTSQAVTVGTTPLATITGSLAASGVATFDVPRNVVAAWTGTAVLTITGTDQYGETLVEASASGTSLAGKKAFKTVTAVSFSADVTGATVGSGNVLGLPLRVDINGLITAKVDNAVDAATFVPAVTTSPATATTGDVRGTLDFSSDGNASRTLGCFYMVADPSTKIGAYGVAQFGG